MSRLREGRPRGRAAILVPCALVLVLAAACSTRTGTGTATGGTVPASAAATPGTAHGSPATLIAPPAGPASSAPGPVATTACAGGNLSLRAAGRPGDTQDVGVLLVIGNKAGPCTLSGTPRAWASESTGTVVSVPADSVKSLLPPGAGRAPLPAGGTAYIRIRVPSGCAKGANVGPPLFTGLKIDMAGATFQVPGLALPALCGMIFVSPYYA